MYKTYPLAIRYWINDTDDCRLLLNKMIVLKFVRVKNRFHHLDVKLVKWQVGFVPQGIRVIVE